MTSIVAQPIQIHPANVTQSSVIMDIPLESPPVLSKIKTEGEKPRGRRRSRTQITSKDSNGYGSGADGDEGQSSGGDGTDGPEGARKRRRSRKGLDKKFECPQGGCGKSYSRAEHLYRHQLNHTPKQIYSCDFPDCDRTFVRQDLCNRHKERHTAKGSQLQRKDAMLSNVSPITSNNTSMAFKGSMSPEVGRPGSSGFKPRTAQAPYQSPAETLSGPFSPVGAHTTSAYPRSGSLSATADPSNAYPPAGSPYRRSNSDNSIQSAHTLNAGSMQQNSTGQGRHAGIGGTDGNMQDNTLYGRQSQHSTNPGFDALSPNQRQQSYVNNHNNGMQVPMQQPYVNAQNFTPFSLPPPGFSPVAAPASTTTSRDTESSYVISPPQTSMSIDYQGRDTSHPQQSGPDMMLLDQMAAVNTMPVFGGEGYNRSPFAIPDDFVAFLFSGQHLDNSSPMSNPALGTQGYSNYPDAQNQYQPYFANEINLGGYFPQNPQHPMAVTSLLDTSTPEMILSEDKSQEIIDLIKERFNETDHAPVAKQKEALLDGDRSNDSHMMSRKMMQTYIGSFWWHFHPQLPILHKPTFSPEKTPNLLLIAMMAIGASCLDKMHGYNVTQSGAELANFLAWHLRWEIFSDVHFRPPAKLWVFQALLLLEIYEKMYSTRALHERAHIHHATTITLMRRGSSLIGRSALDSPPSVRDERQGPNDSKQSSTSGANTPDEWWNHWITNEATRRAAFAAFVIDSVHATMFGHSTVMVAHEMRLPLPCDEALWSATNSAEVGRIEASLHANGVKPVSFLEGLKRTLNAQEVRTNAFGRSILMAGLLSVSWHMNQRDLQVNSLGVSQVLGGRDKWRGSLTRAFDLWKQDFDRSLAHNTETNSGPYTYTSKQDEDTVFESRTVLHHLAHMAMHVDIVDCQIFARAKRLLGRTIGTQDLNSTQRKMKDIWAPTAKARDATYYAIRFLCTVLLPEDTSSGMHMYDQDTDFDYSARDDVLMNRSWVLYFAALIVWCYAFALEGPTQEEIPSAGAFQDQVFDMRVYLRRLSNVKSPEELKSVSNLNGCTGMLMVLRHTFEKTRWELLHEAANLLTNCIQLISTNNV
ncbi:hypothetical protein VE01_06940 [Pseudogymnoascus verrucosus]|uniref:C2H2-type domain-containing protein n=1 Tax=Pseudogymnoascus verrucosus TaxID=342668 RepID=A0A1B8GJX1_9PEZI|nr:uncharacterized protein VE01_06940 [Pseudogymnoascus verrucosus]OBT96142.1 hypothetical protein VE01_06940 [Pseudogymnoascus verrucosus]